MSEHITHTGAFEDVARLVLHAGVLDDDLENSLRNYYDTALCATSSRGNHYFAVPLLEEVRDRKDRRGEVSEDDQKLVAASLGWLAHRAVDNKLDDEIVPQLEQLREDQQLTEEEANIDEHQIYEDAVVFRNVYDGGRRSTMSSREPFSPATLARHMESHPGASAVDVEAVELLFGALWQREVLQLQRFTEEEDDPEAWLDTVQERRQVFSENLELYVEAFQNPDEDKMRYYFEEVNTYDESDPIIRLARAIQTDEDPLPDIDLQEAREAAVNQSAYARALAQAYENLEAGSGFFNHNVEKSTLYDTIDNQYNRY